MRLTVLGCSGSVPGPTSPASSYLVTTEDTSLVLDLGSGAFGPLMATTDPSQLDAVVLSHLHPDHCADLTALAVWLRYGPSSPSGPVRVLGPEGTRERLLELTHLAPADLAATFAVEIVHDGEPTTVGDLTLVPHAVLHPVPAFGYRVTGLATDGGVATLGYTGDTDLCDGVSAVADGVDLLLAEAAFEREEEVRGIHLTGGRAGGLATAAGARALVLTHLQPWADAGVVYATARAAYAGPTELAAAGAIYDL